jgi:hypothetical protein
MQAPWQATVANGQLDQSSPGRKHSRSSPLLTKAKMERVMKSFLAKMVVLMCIVLCATAHAEERVVEVWTCTLNEGRSVDDLKPANVDWLEFVNGAVDGGGVISYIVSPLVGAQGQFMYVDSFPSMDAWIAMKAALLTEEGVALEAALAELASCDSNSLHISEEIASK